MIHALPNKKNNNDIEKALSCRMCSFLVKEPVVTPCGHLYCWKCLYTDHANLRTVSFMNFCRCYFCGMEFEIHDVISLYIDLQDSEEKLKSDCSKNFKNSSPTILLRKSQF